MLPLVSCVLALAPLPTQELLQLQRADGGSVAGAEVRSVRIEAPLGLRPPLSFEMLDDPDRAVDGVAIADESGRVDVGALEGEWLVATLPGWWGCRQRSNDEEQPTLRLHPDHDLVVQVVDDVDGKPLGDVPVRMRSARDPWMHIAFAPMRSARDTGMVRLRHVEFLRREWFRADTTRVQVDAFPRSSGAFVEAPEPFDARPIVLRYTALPTLCIEAVDKEGGRLNQSFEVLLAHDPKTAPVTSASAILHRDRTKFVPGETLVVAGKDGLVTAERVDVRAGLFAYVRRNALSDWSGRVVDPALAGPLRLQPGEGCESILVTLKLGEERISTGTVLVRQAVAWQGTWWRLAAESPTDSELSHGVELPTSEIRIDLAPESRADWGVIAFSLTTSDGKERFAIVDLRDRGPEPVHALDIDLADCDASVSGVVLNRRGVPVPDALVQLDLSDPNQASAFKSTEAAHIRVGRTFSDSNGRFEIPCPPNGLFRVVASAPNLYDESLYGVVAREQVTLRLSGHGDLRGVLHATGPLGSADLNVLLLRYAFAGDKQPSAGFTIGCSCDGLFEFKNAREARYTLLVRRARSGAPPIELLRVEDIEIVAGELTDLGELRIE